jgi:hypothetical protein
VNNEDEVKQDESGDAPAGDTAAAETATAETAAEGFLEPKDVKSVDRTSSSTRRFTRCAARIRAHASPPATSRRKK